MTKNSARFYGFICLATFTKLLVNTARRMVYPFAPAFARGLGVDLAAVTSLIAVNQLTSLLGPLGASFGDQYGYRRLVVISLGLAALGCFAAGFIPLYGVLLACMLFTGLAKCIADPSFQAFVGDSVPYEQRGKYIGTMELAWAGATLLGIPAAGLVIQEFSFQTPFILIGSLILVCLLLILRLMPPDPVRERTQDQSAAFLANWKRVMKNRQVLGLVSFAFFTALGSDALFVTYGAWLEQSYGLSLAAIGFGTILIGLAELLGEALTAMFSDRVGLKRSILLGTLLSGGAYLLLPLLDQGVPFVLGGLFLVFLCFEFTVVTAMSLATELVPDLRASTMSAFYAIGALGRVAGAFTGGLVWMGGGITAVSMVAGGVSLAGLICLLLGFRRGRSTPGL